MIFIYTTSELTRVFFLFEKIILCSFKRYAGLVEFMIIDLHMRQIYIKKINIYIKFIHILYWFIYIYMYIDLYIPFIYTVNHISKVSNVDPSLYLGVKS